MAIIQFENGMKVNFDGNPTSQDIEEVARNLGISKPAPAPAPKKSALASVEKATSKVMKPLSSLFSNTAKFVGGALGNVTNATAAGLPEVKAQSESDAKLTEIDQQAIQRARELNAKGDKVGAERLLEVVRSHGSNITLNDILPDFQQNNAKQIIGAGAGTFLEQASFAKGSGLPASVKTPITKTIQSTPILKDIPAAYEKVKVALPKSVGAVKGAVTAARDASLFGAAAGLQEEGATPGSVLKKSAEYATNPIVLATGGALGALAGKLSSEGAKIVQDKARQKAQKAVDDLEQSYIELATNNQGLKKKYNKAKVITEYKNLSGTEGVDPARKLAELGVVPKQSGSKLDTFVQAEKLRQSTEKLNSLNKKAIADLEPFAGPQSLKSLEDKAVARVRTQQNIDAGTAVGLEKEIRNEFAQLKNEYGDAVPLGKIQDIKVARGKKVFDTTRPNLNGANEAIRKTAQKEIEDVAKKFGFEDVAQLNREQGDIFAAADFLEALNGKTLKGGRLGKYALSIAGASVGKTPLGKILGFFGGDAVANLLITNSVTGPRQRRILEMIQQEDPAVYKRAVEWLAKNKIEPNIPLALPPGTPSTPRAPITLPQNDRSGIIPNAPGPRILPQEIRPGQKALPPGRTNLEPIIPPYADRSGIIKNSSGPVILPKEKSLTEQRVDSAFKEIEKQKKKVKLPSRKIRPKN